MTDNFIVRYKGAFSKEDCKQIIDYIDNALNREDRKKFEEYLNNNKEFRDIVEDFKFEILGNELFSKFAFGSINKNVYFVLILSRRRRQ